MTGAKLAGSLGLASRAGRITVGTYLVLDQIRKGKAALVVFAADAGRDAQRKLAVPAEKKGIPVRQCALSKKELAQAVGKSGEAVCVSVPQEFLNLVLASL